MINQKRDVLGYEREYKVIEKGISRNRRGKIDGEVKRQISTK